MDGPPNDRSPLTTTGVSRSLAPYRSLAGRLPLAVGEGLTQQEEQPKLHSSLLVHWLA